MSFRLMFFTAILMAMYAGAPAHAFTHFVASNGTDSGNCIRTAPCATIAAAFTNASPNDTIACLDVVAGGGLNIIKSIDIDCSGARAILRDSGGLGGAAITVNIPVSALDPFRTVRLRGLSIMGAEATSRFFTVGIDIQSATVVTIEDVVVADVGQHGILDRPADGQTKMFITDTIVRNCSGPGIVAGAAAVNMVVLDNVRSENNAYGVAVAAGNNVVVNRSVLSGNSIAGVEGDVSAQVVVNNSNISHNNIGVQSAFSIRLSNNDIAFNATAIAGASGTFGNNRFSGNGAMGTAPTPLSGQQ